MDARRINVTKLIIGGFLYTRSRKPTADNPNTYWDCKRLRSRECGARAVTTCIDGKWVIVKGPDVSEHEHALNREEVESLVIQTNIKRRAEENLGEPPTGIVRDELEGLSEGVLSQLLERTNLTKTIRRVRRKNMPPNPKSLDELHEIPDKFQKTLTGDQFLLYDSRESEDLGDGRVLVFATKRNLELLALSEVWYVDGTFKVAPTIFTQVFTILGSKEGNRRTSEIPKEVVSLPFVYALMSSKESIQYSAVLRSVLVGAERFNIPNFSPRKIMNDFEKAIVVACSVVYPEATLSGCFFHLGQSMFRKIQSEGLQSLYDAPDRQIKTFTHMLLALAFLPEDEVYETFKLLQEEAPEELHGVFKYFEEYYVIGKPATGRGRGRVRAVAPRHPISFWNVYDATLQGQQRTNNVSEGWHNRFRRLMGKDHPDLYSALKQIQKEQGDVEISLVELAMRRVLKAAPKRKWHDNQRRLQNIVENYNASDTLQYLRAIANNISL